MIYGNLYITTEPWIPPVRCLVTLFALFALGLIGDILRGPLDLKTGKAML